MRIRTIKPEFWANEKMAAMPDFTRLLAIGLLNYADDHGYFWANHLLIRGAVFPFEEDSTRIRRSLAQLATLGYVMLGKTQDGRECGWVVNFTKYQRVDRAKDSDIKLLARFDDESTKDRRSLDDESTLEGKGRERKGKDSSCPDSGESDEEVREEEKKQIHEGEKFVGWFLQLLADSGAPEPKLTRSVRENWADCYRKMIEIDGRTKDQVKAVCYWARHDEFWRKNFLSPMKLREKKEGVMWFDFFLSRMGNEAKTSRKPAVREIPEPTGWQAFVNEHMPDCPYGQGNPKHGCKWAEVEPDHQDAITKAMAADNTRSDTRPDQGRCV